MILRLILILCFLRLLLIAESNIDYYNILFYLIIYLSIREYIFYLKNKKVNNPDKIVEGLDDDSGPNVFLEKIKSWLDSFDQGYIDEFLIIFMSGQGILTWSYGLIQQYSSSGDITSSVKQIRSGVSTLKGNSVKEMTEPFRSEITP
tara:strand:+ start:132 stop:572 length:441 start_codon:yes stop_codon:yes gene_type:complete